MSAQLYDKDGNPVENVLTPEEAEAKAEEARQKALEEAEAKRQEEAGAFLQEKEDLEKLKQDNEEILVDYFNENYGGNYDEDQVEDALDRWLSNLDEDQVKEIIRQNIG